ncbi:MAG: hypothetical protein AB1752_06995 [Candidatus Zixiibacteriota bacterium]
MPVAIVAVVDTRKDDTTMNTTRYRYSYPARSRQARADRTTVWLLLLVVTALVIALTFSDAGGMTLTNIL